MPLSAADATKRRTMSPPTGRAPTRKRPRIAIASGVVVCALSARIRSHGLSTPLPHGRVEGAAARDLEAREPGGVEHLRELEQRGGGHGACERLLSEDANRRVDQPWHDGRP